MPSSEGLSYFDRRTERFTHRFQHDDANPHSLDSNAIFSVYQDRGGVLWVGTENAGLNILNFRQQQFVHYRHRPADPDSLSPGRVKAIHQDPDGVLWVGLFPRALDRLDRKTGQIIHYLPGEGDENTLGAGTNVNSIYRDPAGYLWVGGGGSGLVRFDERTGRFKRYRHDPRDPRSLISNNVYTIYGDRSGQMWVGLEGGISRFDPATDGFVNYRPVPENPASLANTVWVIYQDRSGALWAGTWGGVLIRFDDKAKTFVSYAPDSRDPRRLNGGGINTILEDRAGTLWVGAFDGLYRHDRRSGAFARYTETPGPAQQQHSMHSGRSTRQALAQHPEGRIPVRSSEGNVQKLRRVRRTAEQRVQHRVFSGPGWGDLLRRQQWVERIRPRERSG